MWMGLMTPMSDTSPATARAVYAQDLVARLVVHDDEVVGFNHIFGQTCTRATLASLLGFAEVAGANAAVIVDNLMELPRRFVLIGSHPRDEST
jgi:hypothetical protein